MSDNKNLQSKYLWNTEPDPNIIKLVCSFFQFKREERRLTYNDLSYSMNLAAPVIPRRILNVSEFGEVRRTRFCYLDSFRKYFSPTRREVLDWFVNHTYTPFPYQDGIDFYTPKIELLENLVKENPHRVLTQEDLMRLHLINLDFSVPGPRTIYDIYRLKH